MRTKVAVAFPRSSRTWSWRATPQDSRTRWASSYAAQVRKRLRVFRSRSWAVFEPYGHRIRRKAAVSEPHWEGASRKKWASAASSTVLRPARRRGR